MIRNLLLVLLSIFVGLMGGEFYLRNHMDPTTLFGPWFVPEQTVKGFEWQFLRSATAETDFTSNVNYLYGWDTSETGIRLSRDVAPAEGEGKTILLVGNSFVFGSEVQADETISARLQEHLPNIRTINMGVPGFGIDQAYLKLISKGLETEPDIVIFGIHPPNYERTTVSFHALPKPVAIIDAEGDLDFAEPYETLSTETLYQEIRDRRKHDLFLVNALIKLWHLLFRHVISEKVDGYFLKYNPIVEKIITYAKNKSENIGATFIVLQIPHGVRFKSNKNYNRYEEKYPINKELIKIYEASGVPFIDLEKEFLKRHSLEEIFENLYTHPGGPRTVGHLSKEGNNLTAKIIAARLKAVLE